MSSFNKIWRHPSGKIALIIVIIWTIAAGLSLLEPLGSPTAIDKIAGPYAPPLSVADNGGKHWLGTDAHGRDVLAGILEGSGYSWAICSLALVLSMIFGFAAGLISGFYENKGIRLNIAQLILLVIGLCSMIYMSIFNLWSGIVVAFLVLALVLIKRLQNLSGYRLGLPLDSLLLRLVEVKESIPGLIIILFIVGLTPRSNWFTLSWIIALFLSLTIARYVRAETIKIKSADFVQSARSTGLKPWSIMIYHILPNILPYIFSILVFSVAGIILLESSLSFLGIGVAIDEITWGKILSSARSKPAAWWLAVFPGLAIFLLIYAFNEIGVILTQSEA